MTAYRERLEAGVYDANGGEAEKSPRRHADLDKLAAARGVEWSAEGLTVAEKRAELGLTDA